MSQYQDFQNTRRQALPGRARWSAIELLAMVLGFIYFWPIGLAILGLKIWQRRTGHSGDLVDAAQSAFSSCRGWSRDKANAMDLRQKWNRGPAAWSGASAATGNSAFDDWRSAELAKLEEQRAKLAQSEKDFADHIDGLRRARDREEFDRFMAARAASETGHNP